MTLFEEDVLRSGAAQIADLYILGTLNPEGNQSDPGIFSFEGALSDFSIEILTSSSVY